MRVCVGACVCISSRYCYTLLHIIIIVFFRTLSSRRNRKKNEIIRDSSVFFLEFFLIDVSTNNESQIKTNMSDKNWSFHVCIVMHIYFSFLLSFVFVSNTICFFFFFDFLSFIRRCCRRRRRHRRGRRFNFWLLVECDDHT